MRRHDHREQQAEHHQGSKMKIFWGILGIIATLTSVAICWSVAYLLSPYLYKMTGSVPNAFVNQVINSLLGFFIFGCILLFIGRLNAPKRMDWFKTLIDAMKRIAQGDYNVKLPVQPRNSPFGEIIDSINYMAVELNQMELLRQEFISNVSHEIQSPLTSISGFAKVLQNSELSQEERTHYLGIIEMESNRLAKLSDNLLKLTSLESEHHPVELISFRLDKKLRNIILTCEPQWFEKALEMDINLDEIQITADEELISQVWVNLISNSIKFTADGGTIGISLNREEQTAVIRISDTGIGISNEGQAHIFERFYKEDKSRNRAAPGSGLGLAIVKKIIDMHKGTISVDSKPGEGTTITVHLPIQPN